MATKAELIASFNPSGIGQDNGNFGGLPFDYDTADLILVGVPWEVTVSYHTGTALGPEATLTASRQLDLYDFDNPDGWKQGIFMLPIPAHILAQNQDLRPQAARIIDQLAQGKTIEKDPELVSLLATINQAGEAVNQWVFEQSQKAINLGKRVGVIGGDHSVPLGHLRAIATKYHSFGILHIDAHADLRKAYEGFQFSHASIMYNALEGLPQLAKLVQVGVRDLCQEESDRIAAYPQRISAHFDPVLKQKRYAGVTWLELCRQMIAELPQQVYVSFDVDGLDPKLCPHTGTPVPGGLELEEAFCLLREVVHSGRQIIGFDVSEVGNDPWDGGVATKIVYKLCNLMGLDSWTGQ
jgi:agmatinase